MERQPVVWLVNEGGHEYKDLTNYGRVIVLTKGNVNPFNTDRLMVNLGFKLRPHAQEEDWIAVSGLPIINALVLAMWLSRFEKAKLLLWSTKREVYEPRTVKRETMLRLITDQEDLL